MRAAMVGNRADRTLDGAVASAGRHAGGPAASQNFRFLVIFQHSAEPRGAPDPGHQAEIVCAWGAIVCNVLKRNAFFNI